MKEMTVILTLLSTLLLSCHDDTNDEKRLSEQLEGEWDIVQIAYLAGDSTVAVAGEASFGSCVNNCRGYFNVGDSVVHFNYDLFHFPDVPSKITIGPDEGGGSGGNALDIYVGTYDILVLDDHNLTINVPYCDHDADNNCITAHRHFIMTR